MLRLLQSLDRRYLYALLLLSVTLPFFVPFQLPVAVTPATKKLYDAIERLPANSFVLVGVDWSAGSRGENRPQTEMILRHLMARHLRFAILAFSDPQGATLGEELAKEIAPQYGYIEGVNWVNFGYRVDMVNWLKAFIQNVPQQVKTDVRGVPVASLPVMQGIRTARDIAMAIDITPTASYQYYIQFLTQPLHIPLGVGLTAVMAPEAYNYVDSGQLVGMMAGLTGAAEYQALFARQYDPRLPLHSRVNAYSNANSIAHLLIITFILLGNVAMFLEKRGRLRATRRG
jgi:hypothetical protein